MFARLKNALFGRSSRAIAVSPRRGRFVRARYDAASTNDDNRRHWANADGLSANAANSAAVRRTLRNRARYEIANNSYARGIVLTLANDCVGTGPRLQLLTADAEANRRVESAYAEWADDTGSAEKLRTLRMAKAEDGEGFAVLTNNPGLRSPVKLDLKLVEADQVASPFLSAILFDEVDGIRFDQHGNPVEYHVLRDHPGSTRFTTGLEVDRLKAESVIHYFRADRPGQARGIPEITSALPLFANLRRYTLAVIAAAETAADMALTIQSDGPPNSEDSEADPFEAIELEKRMATVLPEGWKLGQAKAEQPTTTHEMFVRATLNELARCLNMPFNIAAGNSSGYNYSSGRLDHQMYFKSIRVERSQMERVILDRLLYAWLGEATLIEGLLPQSLRRRDLRVAHQWVWDGQEHVDPQKEASAQEIRLRNHTTTHAAEYAKEGRDWEAEFRQIAKELALKKELGIPLAAALPPAAPKPDPELEEAAA